MKAWLLAAMALPSTDKLLRQPVRRRLLDLIRGDPGIHASQLCRDSGEAWGTVAYHLNLLADNELIGSMDLGREKRFFPSDLDPVKARMLSLLSHGRRGEIAAFIQQNPGLRQVDVCEGVAVSRKTFRSSIEPLIEEGLVQERRGLQTNRYYPEDNLGALLGPSEGPDVA